MRRALIAAGALAAAVPALAQSPVEYQVHLDDVARQQARITVTYRDLPAGTVYFRMARASPGRYALHEFAKNVYAVSAVDGRGRTLALDRRDPYGWYVPRHDGTISVTYTLFGDRGDGTYAQLDASHAHLNAPASFLWAEGQDARPVRVRFKGQPRAWKVATQLKAEADGSYSAPNLQYFMDSPIEVSDHAVYEWPLAGTNYRIGIALHHAGSDADGQELARRTQRIVAEHVRMWGDVPAFDHGRYTFIVDALPWASRDGMEHRNSTIVSGPRALRESGFAALGTMSHEFFHAWNVERLRPAELEPFDFTRANPTPSLWFAEGVTNYYGPLAMVRAGEQSLAEFASGLAEVINQMNGPARAYGGPLEMSLRAPFADAATSIDPRAPNIFVSYYTYGQAVGLALDLTLRRRFRDLSLDDYMRALWRKFGRDERPYTTDGLRVTLGEVTRDRAFADRFFAETIAGNALPDWAPLLAQAGLVIRPAKPDAAWLGPTAWIEREGELMLDGYPPADTPLGRAGISKGDVLLALGTTQPTTPAALAEAMQRLRPGATVRVRFRQRGVERDATLVAAADPTVAVLPVETLPGGRPTSAQRRFRAAWLEPGAAR